MPEEERQYWTKRNLAIKITGPHVVECLEKHGWTVTLHQCVAIASYGTHGQGDDYLNELLSVMPTIYAMREFFKRMPTYEVDAETFEYLMKSGSFL